MKERANMRDRFAAFALQGLLSSATLGNSDPDNARWARKAYDLADAMMQARKTLPKRRSVADGGTKP